MDRPINGDGFRAHVEPFLLLTLKVMNNLGSHKRGAIGCLIRAAPVLASSFCRPTHPISTRSSRCSPTQPWPGAAVHQPG
jgi:hypothetical protein